MADVLIANEWVRVEESAEDIERRLRADEAPPVPMMCWILLTTPSYQTVDESRQRLSQHPRRRMKIAVSAIHGIREEIVEDDA